ncbi:hypothetical protein [Stenotrophomonas maltophilia]|uniref:hypothetical protein n=1 Tax=Stenotrophomonas maltophilia TaxID=40324 RepID=UPI0021B0AA1B|nr:hypothetical protein [Stenotrophomonas maltophilia]
MSPVALYSPDPARGWLPWAWLTPILMILFNAVPVMALDGWMQSQHWSTPRGDPIGLAGLQGAMHIACIDGPGCSDFRAKAGERLQA